MNLMKKFMKKSEGFTLVELIVVIAILAILAGVAVPAYTGYINKANQSADDSQIVALNQAIEAACALNGCTPAEITTCTVTSNAVSALKVTVNSVEKDIYSDYTNFLSGNTVTLKYYTSVVWDGDADVLKGNK